MTQDQLTQLRATTFNRETGNILIWPPDLELTTLDAAVEEGLMTRKFYRHLYGHTEYTLTPEGRAQIERSQS